LDIESDSPTSAYVGRPHGRANKVHGLTVVAGPASGARRLIDEEEIRIGKAPSNHLCVPDPTVSRFHCVIERTARGLLLRDLGSFNGTKVGGAWVESAYLTPDVPIQIGNSVLQVFVAEAEGRAPVDPRKSGPRVLGNSTAMESIVAVLPRVAQSGGTVLLEGETGTGKSMIAEMIHRMGPRAGGPFVVVDCGALAPSLVESELFGHERGAFTGAGERRIGAFEAALGGTVFLDEIGELPLELQPKLLRALEERTVRRLGSTQAVRLDVQVVAATNRDLREAVSRGTFRADLYYRLEALRLVIPPLRERREDIPPLVEHFCRRTRADIPEALVERMKSEFTARHWPGNVRELRNAVERMALLLPWMGDPTQTSLNGEPPDRALPRSAEPPRSMLGQGNDRPTEPIIEPGMVSAAPEDSDAALFTQPFRQAKENAVEQWERRYLTALMKHVQGNISRAARLVQVDRGHLRDLLRRHQIPTGEERA
jgi:transcriptional regulator with GAF, ATPase, and Fis domain